MKNNAKDSYWMLAEVALPLASNIEYKNSFEAYFKHGLLFNSRLMISDTQALNCTNLRQLIIDNEGFEQFISPDFLSIALRNDASSSYNPSLIDLRDEFYRENKTAGSDKSYLSNGELELLQQNSNIVEYGFKDLAQNFTSKTIDIFNNDKSKKLFGDDASKIITERINIEYEKKKSLSRQFLHIDLKSDLNSLGCGNIWETHKENIMKLADAPYITGIPTVLDANPIYSPVHQESFTLASRAPKTGKAEKTGFELDLSLMDDLSVYEHALSILTAEDILILRNTGEYQKYQRYITGGVSTEREQQDAMVSLSQYQQVINEHILSKVLGKKVGKQSFIRKNLQAIKHTNDGANQVLGLLVDMGGLGSIYGIINYFASKKLDSHGYLSEKEKTQGKTLLNKEIKINTNKIDAKLSATASNNEVIYSSIIE
ncbi:hypothetical protein [Thalassotalea castellviae]|uniref:Uncharacterized protein n=1 Tax=Thalassotalea castellviae TaxID=3075612 RepID=A0ABU2ZWP8_9GAMM|nr:hypothetical protein [Thalassotalea sp. W431]MDT0602344.1 hypothetical protein [Thalassotalea sp. W431]